MFSYDNIFSMRKIFVVTNKIISTYLKNKSSFCSDSCDEIHATTKLNNKTSDSWNTLKQIHEVLLKYTWHFI